MARTTVSYELFGGPLDGETRHVPGPDSHYTFPFCRGGLHTYAVGPRPARGASERDYLLYLSDRPPTRER